MSLLTRIKEDQLLARKARDDVRATLLTTLYAEAAMVGKSLGNRESTDDEVVAVIKRFLKGIEDTLGSLWDPKETRADPAKQPLRERLRTEQALLAAYLPAQATEAQLQAVIEREIAALAEPSPRAMGTIMAALKKEVGGHFDGRFASNLIKARMAKS